MARRLKPRADNARVLLIDDDREYAEVTKRLLEREGHDVTMVHSGREGLDVLQQRAVDLVLLDYVMPGMTGDLVVKQLREFNDYVQVVLQTGYATEHPPRTLLKQLDVQGYHDKSEGPEKLLMWVDVGVRAARAAGAVRSSREGLRHVLSVTPGLHRLQPLLELLQGTLLQLSALLGNAHSFLALCRSTAEQDPAHFVVRASTGRFENLKAVADSLPEATFQAVVAAMRQSELQVLEGNTVVPLRAGSDLVGALFIDNTVEDIDLVRIFSHRAAAAIHSSQLLEAEREQAEIALRISEDRHRVLFDASPVPIWVFDPTTLQILAVNDALVQVLGYSRAELLSMRVPQLNSFESDSRLLDSIGTRSGDKPRHVGILRYRCKGGRHVDLDVTSHVTILEGTPVILALGIDVTHSRKIEDQLRQSQKMDAIGQLAGGVAHDFNNIIAVILGSTDFLVDELGEHHPLTPEVREIDAAAQRAAALTRQLLTFSRQQRRKTTTVELNSVVSEVSKMLARVVGEDIEMVTTLAPELWKINADSGQLEQVLMNLAVNARDAMPNGGRLSVETSNVELDQTTASQLGIKPGPFVMLAVGDSGVGMDAETQARAFEPFFTTKEVGKGTGLGLSTVFGIINQSAGAISITSDPGVGTTFRVYLPRHEGRGAAPSPVASVPKAVAGNQRVLLVEDDDRLRAVIGRQLTSWGYRLFEARNAASALDLVQTTTESIDLLLTDLVMPGMDGRALAHLVLTTSPTTKVLFMSGHTHHPSVKTPLSAHEQFIEKPFTSSSLSTAIRRALET